MLSFVKNSSFKSERREISKEDDKSETIVSENEDSADLGEKLEALFKKVKYLSLLRKYIINIVLHASGHGVMKMGEAGF